MLGVKGTVLLTPSSIVYYTYDGYGRLSMEEAYDLNEDYIYDRCYYYNNRGNRTREYKDDDEYHYSYSNANNKLTSYYDDNELVTFSYDDNGNLTSKVIYDYDTLNETGRITYEYDNFNRLISYTEGNNTTTYSYYADNLRASKTDSNSNTTSFIWNGQNLAYEGTGTDAKYYSYDITGIAAVKTGSEQKLYAKNPHNDIIGQINSSGVLSGAKDFNSFGELVSCTSVSGFGYAGEYHDTESGYIYLRNRYYDPSIGRFITEDPAKDGTNWYVYCGNNPVMFKDPLGLWKSGDENLPYLINYIINGADGKTGGLTAKWYEAKTQEEKNKIAKVSDMIRCETTDYDITKSSNVMLLLDENGAREQGHMAVLIQNSDGQGIYFSYSGEDGTLLDDGMMNMDVLKKEEMDAFFKTGDLPFTYSSSGTLLSSNYTKYVTIKIDSNSGSSIIGKAISYFWNPGTYWIAGHQCDNIASSIMGAGGKGYVVKWRPKASFNYAIKYFNVAERSFG